MDASRPALPLLLLLATVLGCGEPAPTNPEGGAVAVVGDAARGKAIYKTSCGACHNANPALPGATGPAVAGASRELIEARVVHGTYPPGYTPKQETKLMAALPHLAPEVEHLAAYLGSVSPTP